LTHLISYSHAAFALPVVPLVPWEPQRLLSPATQSGIKFKVIQTLGKGHTHKSRVRSTLSDLSGKILRQITFENQEKQAGFSKKNKHSDRLFGFFGLNQLF